jgi:uncharacterized tellurite resistance protein B-like protein
VKDTEALEVLGVGCWLLTLTASTGSSIFFQSKCEDTEALEMCWVLAYEALLKKIESVITRLSIKIPNFTLNLKTMEEKRSMISELIELAKVDDHVSEQEIGFIQQIGNMLGMEDADILKLFKEPAPFHLPNEHFDRIVHFQQMVLLMNVDQEVDNSEISHLRYMGMKLGLNPKAVNEVLKRMYEFPNNMIPADELLKIYSKYLN